jgi:serine/threonine protein kinase
MSVGAASSSSSLSLLTRLGSYELERLLAQGGMADVYLARHVQLDRRVAIKVLSHTRSGDPEARALFLDEARLLALFDHPNLATVYEVDIVGGMHYLAMEYVHGADLRELLAAALRADRAIPYDVALAIVTAAATGLDHAHRRSGPDGAPLHLVHRDVSLSNIMLGHDGSVKVIDFGIASAATSTVHTAPGVVRGKASYMSPEQCLGDPVDCRTDVFALGIVLYELTTGHRCFPGNNDFERMLAVVRGEYVLPRQLVPDYPEELEAVVRRALEIEPAARFQSAKELVDAIALVAAKRDWIAGSAAIQKLMGELFAAVAESVPVDRNGRTADALAPVAAETAPIHDTVVMTRRPRRAFARGTDCESCFRDRDDDLPTRGRRSVPRIHARPASRPIPPCDDELAA